MTRKCFTGNMIHNIKNYFVYSVAWFQITLHQYVPRYSNYKFIESWDTNKIKSREGAKSFPYFLGHRGNFEVVSAI